MKSRGFTIVELIIVVIVIGILAGITIVGYGAWRSNIAESSTLSDLNGAATAMESARNFSSGYPTDIPTTFTPSESVTLTYVSGNAGSFCLEGRNSAAANKYFFYDSVAKEAAVGTCAGGKGATPDSTIFVYDTTMVGCTANTVQLPISAPSSAAGSVIDWGDGSTQALTTTLQSHVYATAGTYTVKYTGPITTVNTFSIAAGSRPCLKQVRQWGQSIAMTAMSFRNSTNLASVPALPSTVTNLQRAFSGTTSFNQNISSWNTANVTNMSDTFSGAAAFNQPIGSWNTANVTDMSSMFSQNTAFNQALNTWNTTKVTTTAGMFYQATAFNQNISSWNTSNVTEMSSMFNGATAFNQNLSSWNVTKVVTKPPLNFSTGATAWVLPKPTW